MNELCIARMQWNNRVNIESHVDNFIKQHTQQNKYYGIIFAKNNLSIAEVNYEGI